MLRSIYLSIIIVWSWNPVFAQENDVEQQYFINKWIYNPAQFDTKSTIVSLSYKNQWVGLEGAPSYTRLGLQNYKVGTGYVGALFKHLSDGPFNEYEFLASFGYQAKLSELSILNFGLSLGYGARNIDLSRLTDPGDVGLTNVPPNQGYFQGNFGVNLSIGNANIGASIPRLFDEFISDGALINASTPKVFFFSGSYIIQASSSIAIEPQLLYHVNNNIGEKQLELLGTAYYNNRVWLGFSYRENYGVSAHAGGNVDRFDFSYIYTFPSLGSVIDQSSHEMVVRYRLGEIRKNARTAHPKAYGDAYDLNEYFSSSYQEDTTIKDEPIASSIQVKDLDDRQYALNRGYYIVLGEFYLKSGVLNLKDELEAKGIVSNVIYLESKASYYLYTDYFLNEGGAQLKLGEVKSQSGINSAWVFEAK